MKQQRILDMLEHIDERYILEAAPALRVRRSSGPRKAGRTLLIAAVIVSLFAALCAVAYAAGWFGLSARLTEAPSYTEAAASAPASQEPVETGVAAGGYLSMNGIAGSPEGLAHAEWIAFRNEYVAQHSFSNNTDLSWLGGDELLESYSLIYGAADRAMLDKLLEISEKYNVKLHSRMYAPPTDAKFYKVSGCEPFVLSGNSLSPMYLYEDGSYKFEGYVTAGEQEQMLSFTRGRKGVLDPGGNFIQNAGDYSEWQYTNVSGDELNLAWNNNPNAITGEHRLFIFCDKGDYIFTVFASAESKEQAELLADQFDFDAAAKSSETLDLDSVMNEETAQAKPKEGLMTMADWLATDEYKASSEFYTLVCEYAGTLPENSSYVKGTMLFSYKNSFAVADDNILSFRDRVAEEYPDLVFPINSTAVIGNQIIPDGDMSYSGGVALSERERKICTDEEMYELFGAGKFCTEGSIFRVIAYDNGAAFCDISAFRSGYGVHYIPKGAFYPLIQPVVNPELEGWAYDSACGEQVYIVPSGPNNYPVLSYSSIIYEADSAYVIAYAPGGADAGYLQMVADDIDFTLFE